MAFTVVTKLKHQNVSEASCFRLQMNWLKWKFINLKARIVTSSGHSSYILLSYYRSACFWQLIWPACCHTKSCCVQPAPRCHICKLCMCYKNTIILAARYTTRGSTVVKVLCYKSEGRWFDPSWCQWIFHWHNPSDRTMALGSTQPPTEMSTRSIYCG